MPPSGLRIETEGTSKKHANDTTSTHDEDSVADSFDPSMKESDKIDDDDACSEDLVADHFGLSPKGREPRS